MAEHSSHAAPLGPSHIFSTVDWFFLGLRGLIAGGGLIAFLLFPVFFFPLADAPRRAAAWAIAGYLLSSAGLYIAILRWPERIRQCYLAAVLVDTALVYILVRWVGGNRGGFFILFYLLIAISSFYFGPILGLGVALFSSVLYTHVYLSDSGLDVYPLGDFILRISFFLLIAVSMAFLAERQKADSTRILELNEELTRKNAVLEQAYRYLSLGRLSSSIAESINNPAGILAGRVELLLAEAKEQGAPERMVRDLDVVAKHINRIGAVAKSLLAFSRQQHFEPSPIDLNEVIEEALLLMEAEFEGQRITVRKVLRPSLPLINGDRRGLNEVLVNLLSNAVDAMPEGGTIRIATAADGLAKGVVECVVADDGPGIPRQHLDRIFEPFFTSKSDPGRVGLGLPTCLRIMKQHDGLIRVESPPGGGSTFTLTFPFLSPHGGGMRTI